MAAERVGARAGAHVVAGDEQKIREGGGGVGAAAVLGDAHGEEDADAVGCGDLVGDGGEGGCGMPVMRSAYSRVKGSRDFLYSSKWLTHWLTKSVCGQAVVDDVLGDGGDPDGVGGGVGADEDVGAFGHLVFAKVGDDEPLAAMFVRTLDAGGEDGMVLGGVGADDEDEAGLFDVGDGAGVAAVAYGALQAHGGGVLAVAGAVVDVVGADDGAGELLHEKALLVGALGGGDEGEGVGAVVLFDLL